MSDEIELHDSCVEVEIVGDAVILRLCPAYVHHWERIPAGWRGEGRSQSAEIVIANGGVVPQPNHTIYEVSGGWLEAGEQRYDNMIPVPLECHGQVRGQLQLVNAEPIDLQGDGISVRLVGEAEMVEDLPPEWAPSGDAV
jgi:hypothetical protein